MKIVLTMNLTRAFSPLFVVLLFVICSNIQDTQAALLFAPRPFQTLQNSSRAKIQTQDPQKKKQEPEPKWTSKPKSLFDGKSLEGWETIEFGGQGDCEIKDGRIELQAGDPFTGISSTRDDLPKTNYEISLEARKTDGIDFFCGLTFPVEESHCTLIVGGWGGSTVGLSCIDDQDASRNDTCSYLKFEKNQWYKIRVRVQPETIQVWIDGEKVVDKNIKGKKISLRGDTTLCKPMGLCSFMTVAEYKNIKLRKFSSIPKK
jgi:hypothetical protein